jgi:hypothetical protein
MFERPTREPIAAFRRNAVATRRVGLCAKCACGESRPQALIEGSKPLICAECKRKKEGKSTKDRHHMAGKANSSLRILVPVNDHRAYLSEAQRDWPKETLENPDSNPHRKMAALIRGFILIVEYLLDAVLRPIAESLESVADSEKNSEREE